MIYRLTQFLTKSQQDFSDIDEIILKCVWKGKGTKRSKIILKKGKREESVYPISQLSSVIKTVVLTKGQTPRSVEQNREPRNRPSQIRPVFDKGAKVTQWRKDSVSTNGAGAIAYPQIKKTNFHLSLTFYTKVTQNVSHA